MSRPQLHNRATNRAGGSQETLGLGVQHPPGIGESHMSSAALEERDPELALELSNLLAQRRLRDMQPIRRPTEVQLIRHRNEELQTAQTETLIHIHSILIYA